MNTPTHNTAESTKYVIGIHNDVSAITAEDFPDGYPLDALEHRRLTRSGLNASMSLGAGHTPIAA